MPGYVYANRGNEIFVNLFLPSTTKIDLNGQVIELKQETNYPNDGKIKFKVSAKNKTKFDLNVRIPYWTKGKPVPGDLYSYVNNKVEKIEIIVNNEKVKYRVDKGYAVLSRYWRESDVIELNFKMPVRKVLANNFIPH